VETSILRALVVTAVKQQRADKVAEFFRGYGAALLRGPEAEAWAPWFALAYLPAPEQDPVFQVGGAFCGVWWDGAAVQALTALVIATSSCLPRTRSNPHSHLPQVFFTAEWMSMLVQSTHNFLAEVLRCAPLPGLLRFDADREARVALQQRADVLAQALKHAQAELEAAQQKQRRLDQQQQQGPRNGSAASVLQAHPAPQPPPQRNQTASQPTTTSGTAAAEGSGPTTDQHPHDSAANGSSSSSSSSSSTTTTTAAAASTAIERPRHLRGGSITLDAAAAVMGGDPGEVAGVGGGTDPAATQRHSAPQPVPTAALNIPVQASAGAALVGLLASSPASSVGLWGEGAAGALVGSSGSSPSGRHVLHPTARGPSSSPSPITRGARRVSDASLAPAVAVGPQPQALLPAAPPEQGGALAAAVTLHSPLVGGVSCLAWSPSGDNVASGGSEGLVSIWSAAEAGCGSNAARHASLSCGAPVSALTFDARVRPGGLLSLLWVAQ